MRFPTIISLCIFIGSLGCRDQTGGDANGGSNYSGQDISVQPIFRLRRNSIGKLFPEEKIGKAIDEVAAYAWGQPTPGVAIHMLRLKNLSMLSLHQKDFQEITGGLEEFLFNSEEYQARYGGIPVLLDSPYGASYRITPPRGSKNYDLASTLGAVAHRDQSIAVMFETGQGLSRKLTTPSGRELNLADLLNDSLARFKLSGELEWTLIAYSGYLNDVEFQNSKGAKFTLMEIASELLSRPEGTGSCHGCHRLYSLSVFYARIEHELASKPNGKHAPALKQLMRKLEEYFLQVSRRLVACQTPEGFWDETWHLPNEKTKKASLGLVSKATEGKRIRATGHLLEWMLISPDEFRPPNHVIKKALQYLSSKILKTPEYFADKHLLATSHAIAAIALLNRAP